MKTPSKSQAPKPSHSYLYMRLLSEEGRDFGLGAIRKQAVNEGFGSVDSVDRACAWKIFLGYHKASQNKEEWILEAKQHRDRYTSLLQKYMTDMADAESFFLTSVVCDTTPQYIQISKIIKQDIDRAYPEMDFFRQNWVKQSLYRILYIYAHENPQVSYRQGMHELLAVVLYVLHQGMPSSSNDSVDEIEGLDRSYSHHRRINYLSSSQYLCHDSFVIFEKIMGYNGNMFSNDKQQVINRCKRIFNDILKTRDPTMFAHLNDLDIEPQVYLLRWIRLLFSREFTLETTLVVWDAIFAYDQTAVFGLVDYIACSMLIRIRKEVVDQDPNSVLALLFKYPLQSPEEASKIVADAINLLKPHTLVESLENFYHKKLLIQENPVALIEKSIEKKISSLANFSGAYTLGLSPSSSGEQKRRSQQSELKDEPEPDNNNSLMHYTIAVRLESILELLRTGESIDIVIQELSAIKEVLYGRSSLELLTKLFHLNSIMQDSESHPLSPRSPTKLTGSPSRFANNTNEARTSGSSSSVSANASVSTDGKES